MVTASFPLAVLVGWRPVASSCSTRNFVCASDMVPLANTLALTGVGLARAIVLTVAVVSARPRPTETPDRRQR